MKPLLILTSLCCLIIAGGAQTNVSLELANVSFGDVRSGGFLLRQDQTVAIEAIGGGFKDDRKHYYQNFEDSSGMFIRSWILDAATREVVWQLSLENSVAKNGLSFLREFKGEITLPAGRYETYLSSQKPPKSEAKEGYWTLGEILRYFISPRDNPEEWEDRGSIIIRDVDEVYSAAEVTLHQRSMFENAIVNLTGVRDSEYREASFTMVRRANVEIYGVGEAFEGSCYDFGWIVDLKSGHKVWEMTPDENKPAGGAQKNRQWRAVISLDQGDYRAVFQTDGTHSFNAWNSNPPFDPNFWGMVIRISGQKKSDKIFTPYQPKMENAFLQIDRVGNNQLRRQAFSVDRRSEIRIVALGEGSSGDMSDYAWIVDLSSGKKVWEMTYRKTRAAGGASKNRIAEENILLEKGNYVLYYLSDGSHAYGDWNSRRPPNEEQWGVSLFASGKEAMGYLRVLDLARATNVVIAIRDVGDNDVIHKAFRVTQPLTVLVYAMGEGSDSKMFDYGWISDNNSGRKVWEMDYWRTSHAGGAIKNRFVEEPLELKPGMYQLHYRSDGSHSPSEWNSTIPENADDWGIALLVEKEKQQFIEVIDEQIPVQGKPFIALRGIRSGEYVQRIFELKKMTPVRVVALGEGSDGEMFDYGWIEDMNSGRKVWEMRYQNTRHAGGAHKNRQVEMSLQLSRGRYKLCFRTDDSHAPGDFNASKPREPENWGIAIFMPEEYQKSSSSAEEVLPAGRSKRIVAEINRVGDDEHVRRQFTLTEDTKLRVFAIGEGDMGELYDYGWIEDRSIREVVWIMQYQNTRWAGGARKNRQLDSTISLPSGDYLLHFVTDDSHSFHEWNAAPPGDGRYYGIRLEEIER